ncbi:MAG: RagB/SusD family nutrient uptake outer membrane protein [Prevotellaceae bacterium]|nr:RagB/SusD family nutrient uptake outer membrane protein [Prevotellaceae bacterium]
MKTKDIKILALGLLSLGLASCGEDWLNTESKTDTTTGNFYKTAEEAEIALVGCYDGWQRTVSSGPTFAFYMSSEVMSDECFGGTGNNDSKNTMVIDRFDISQASSEQNLFNDLWTYYYAAIYRCNELITRSENISWSSETSKGTILGQARAIRALCYFDLARLFENVPLITEPTTENVPQASPDSTYALIVSDLKYAAENIPASAFPKSSASSNDGRITCYAAKAMLARVYLFYNGVYGKDPQNLTKAEALQGLEDVISSGEFSLIEHFKNLWPAASKTWTQSSDGSWSCDSTYAGKGNAETVLAMKFNNTSDYNGNTDGNRFIVMMGVRGGTFKAPYGQGWGACTVTEKMVSSFGSGDNRRNASLIDMASEGIEDMSDYQSAGISDQREYTGYFIKKYTPLSKYVRATDGTWSLTHDTDGMSSDGDFQISQYQDYVLMRYADVLLMAAELGSSNAQSYFNQVRQRAYTDDDGTISSYYVQKSATQENIMAERKLEFAFEGLRYWDLLRQGADYAAEQIESAQNNATVLDGGVTTTSSFVKSNLTSKRGFMQIPQTQIDLSNGVLKQNEGW